MAAKYETGERVYLRLKRDGRYPFGRIRYVRRNAPFGRAAEVAWADGSVRLEDTRDLSRTLPRRARAAKEAL